MHSAYLESADSGWRLTYDVQEIIDHDGDLLVNYTKDDETINLGEIESKTGQHVRVAGRTLILTDSKLHSDMAEAREAALVNGSALVWNLSSFVDGIYSPYGNDEEKAKWEGFVSEVVDRSKYISRIRLDAEEWNRINVFRRKCRRREELASLQRKPIKSDMKRAVIDICNSIGVYSHNFTLTDMLILIEIHDSMKGKRATNRCIRTLALKWCNDRAKSRKWLERWVKKEGVVEALDKRLAAVLRLGDRNSRHKPRKRAA